MTGSGVKDDSFPNEGVVSWWSEGRLTVCFVSWLVSDVGDHEEFYKLLRENMPRETRIFGCRVEACGTEVGEAYYYGFLGFPYRLRSWDGIQNHVRIKLASGKEDTASVDVCVCGKGVAQFVEACQFFVKGAGGEKLFGERLLESECGGGSESLPLLNSAEEMWSALEVE